MAVNDGVSVLLKLATTTVNCVTSKSMSLSVDEIEVTTGDSAGNKEFIAGEFSGTISVEGLIDASATYNYDELLTALKAKAVLAFVYGPTAGQIFSGNCIMTGLERTDGKNESSAWSASLRVTGTVTASTIP